MRKANLFAILICIFLNVTPVYGGQQYFDTLLQKMSELPNDIQMRKINFTAASTIADGDTSPSVGNDANFVTANTSATTINALDDGVAGDYVLILVGDANTTWDFTSSNLFGNGGQDYVASQNDLLGFYSPDGTNYYSTFIGKAAGGSGEANTASNVGTDGVGVFYQKTGVDLEFRHIAPGSNKITVTLNGQDIDINVVESNFSGIPLATAVSGQLPIANGGTGASDAAGARTNLGVEAADSTIIKEGELQTTIGDPGSDSQAGSTQAIREALNLKVDLTGGTLTGDLIISLSSPDIYFTDTDTGAGGKIWLTSGAATSAAMYFGVDDSVGDDQSYLILNGLTEDATFYKDVKITTGKHLTFGSTQWDDGSDKIDGTAVVNVVHDSGNETVAGIKTFSSFPVTPSSSPTTDYQVANKKYVDDQSGNITSVLGDSSGAVPVLFQTWSAFTASDTTPDVSTASFWRTVDTTTITDFDGTPVDGQVLYTYCAAATVWDFTSSGLEAWNRSTDLTCTVGQIIAWKYRDTQWYCQNCPDEFETLSSDGIVVNSSGTPYARSIAGGTGITITNGDGTGGNPSIAITSGGVTAALAATVMKTDGWNISLGNDSDAITTGKKILKTVCVPFKHDLEEIGLCTDETSGSITIDVWIDEKGATTGLSEVADADSLFDTASEPVISDASSDNCVAVTSFDSGEDTDIPAGSCYVVNVDAASTLTYANVAFKVTRKD